MIGDSSNDIEAALAAGVPFCGVTYGIGKPIGGKGEKPDFTIEHPMQLLEYLA
jgi:phosphoglycolate phosphatase-like HAD superfamily hydrolase